MYYNTRYIKSVSTEPLCYGCNIDVVADHSQRSGTVEEVGLVGVRALQILRVREELRHTVSIARTER